MQARYDSSLTLLGCCGTIEAQCRSLRCKLLPSRVDSAAVQRLAVSADASVPGQLDLLGPRILASWESYPARMVGDPSFVGVKAAGLLKLPRDWIPPFL